MGRATREVGRSWPTTTPTLEGHRVSVEGKGLGFIMGISITRTVSLSCRRHTHHHQTNGISLTRL